MHAASSEGLAEVVLELLIARSDPNALDALHETALHKAVLGHSPEAIQVLLEGGADPSIGDSLGCTPVLLAAERGKAECLEVLLAKDSSLVTATNTSLWTALHLASHGDQQQRSISSGKRPKFPRTVQCLLEAKADVGARDEDSKTALHRAACTGNADSVALLVHANADLAAEDSFRWTPLHYACQEGHVSVVRVLCKEGAKVQCPNPPCLTPLGVATMENQVKVAEVLMSYGADPNLRGKGLASPAALARKDPDLHSDILALFELGFVGHK